MNKCNVTFGKFKIALGGFASRVVVIPENITLYQVHCLVQTLFGWENCHLWEFEDFEGHRFGPPPPDGQNGFADETLDPASVCLSDVLPARGLKLKYTYDFGDNWQHVISRLAAPKERETVCLKSTGPDGVEDCGGWLDSDDDAEIEPTAEEISWRLASIDLTPLPSKTGLIEKEQAERKELVSSLDDREWASLCALGEGVDAPRHPVVATERLSLLPDYMSGLLCFAVNKHTLCLCADYDFRRYWRKNKKTFLAWRDESAARKVRANE